jgi:hypothetical protein
MQRAQALEQPIRVVAVAAVERGAPVLDAGSGLGQRWAFGVAAINCRGRF